MEEKSNGVSGELFAAYGKLQEICREVCGTDTFTDDEREQMCTRLTRQIRKVRECLTECRRGK